MLAPKRLTMTEKHTLNSTKNYHMGSLQEPRMGTDHCNAYPEGTPLRKLLMHNESFGCLLYDYLSKFCLWRKCHGVLSEVGEVTVIS